LIPRREAIREVSGRRPTEGHLIVCGGIEHGQVRNYEPTGEGLDEPAMALVAFAGPRSRVRPGAGIVRRADGPLPDVLFSGVSGLERFKGHRGFPEFLAAPLTWLALGVH
jgi:hypothetical protein